VRLGIARPAAMLIHGTKDPMTPIAKGRESRDALLQLV
jgi:predicted esterase